MLLAGAFTNAADLGMPSALPEGTEVLVLQPSGWTNGAVVKCVEDVITVEYQGKSKHDWRVSECTIGHGWLRLPRVRSALYRTDSHTVCYGAPHNSSHDSSSTVCYRAVTATALFVTEQ